MIVAVLLFIAAVVMLSLLLAVLGSSASTVLGTPRSSTRLALPLPLPETIDLRGMAQNADTTPVPAAITVAHIEHDNFVIHARDHSVPVDELTGAARGAGLAPVELMVSSVAAAAAIAARRALKGAVPLVRCEYQVAPAQAGVDSIRLDVTVPASTPHVDRAAVETAIRRSPVLSSIQVPAGVSIAVLDHAPDVAARATAAAIDDPVTEMVGTSTLGAESQIPN